MFAGMFTGKLTRRVCALAGAALLHLALVAPALAWSDVVAGEPALSGESPTGYFIWHNESGMHLRTHDTEEGGLYVARLRTDGAFEDVDVVRLETRDGVAVLDGGHLLVYRVHTYNWIDGVDFRVRGGRWLRFDLERNGEQISTDSIHLGAEGKHPPTNPFVIVR